MRLLLIEDDPSVAGSIELMLKSENFQVETTHLGEHGVSLGRVNEYELIVSTLTFRTPATRFFDLFGSTGSGRPFSSSRASLTFRIK